MHSLFTPPLPRYKDARSKSTSNTLHNVTRPFRGKASEEELTVSNLRKLYASLLEEMAPRHYEMGTAFPSSNNNKNNHFRWKNQGTITIEGDDDEGYDYAYTPDNSQKSWRLGVSSGRGGGGMMNGITGGDWSKDGVRRYYTGGSIATTGDTAKLRKEGDILSIGSMDVDISTMNGVGISPETSPTKGEAGENRQSGELLGSDGQFPLESARKEEEEEAMVDVDIADLSDSPSASLEEITLESTTPVADDEAIDNDTSAVDNYKSTFGSNKTNSMTTFESLFHISPTMAWRLRSAYAPTTPQEHDLLLLGSEELAHRHPDKAEGMAKGLELAKECEDRVCNGLWRVGELICFCERMRNRNDNGEQSSNEDDIEAAEAVFAYFCEKNILPMLVDAILCRPPPLSSSSSYDASPSPFSGATWTSAVKAQILQVIAMLLFNTTSPLTLTYLLSNNYMNELIMGMMPLDQWKEEALEEILPPFVTLLRGLVMKLRGEEGRYCVPLLLCQRKVRIGFSQSCSNDENSTEAYLPLLFAAVQVLVSNIGSSLRDGDGCLVKTTAMNVILNLCRVVDPEVRNVLISGLDPADETILPTTKSQDASSAKSATPLSVHLTIEQELLFPYICKSLIACYHRSVRLLMASLKLNNQPSNLERTHAKKIPHHELTQAKEEAASRHKDIASSLLSELRYWLGFLDDLLSCEIRNWNVRLCEYIMSEVIVGTVFLNWNRSTEALEKRCEESMKVSEELKAKAEIRTSVSFVTHFLGMVEYYPLVRMVAAALLSEKYPQAWCQHNDNTLIRGNDFFVVTPILHSMVTSESPRREEADAGAGGSNTAQSNRDNRNIAQEDMHPSLSRADDQNQQRKPSMKASEMDHRALETAAAELNLNDLADQVELHCNEHQQLDMPCVSNSHRTSFLKMLAGDSHPAEVTILACMLFASVLENDAIDDNVLEALGVLPSSESSPFEQAITSFLENYISTHEFDLNVPFQRTVVTAMEYISSLGIMLLERTVYHTWAEDGSCLDEVPLNHYYLSSKLIKALQSSLKYFSTYSLKLSKCDATKDLFADYIETEIRQRYSRTELESPRLSHHEPKITVTCCLSDYFPSNFVDFVSTGTQFAPADHAGNDIEASQLVSQLLLHFRSLVICVQEFHSRFAPLTGLPSIANNRMCDEDEALSFCMIQEADDSILAIGGFQMTRLPGVGTEIDLRGRTVFRGFEYKQQLSIIDASVMALILVIDPEEIYVGRKVRTGDLNRSSVLGVIPIRNVIASAIENSLLHIALRCTEDDSQYGDTVKNGKLTIEFKSNELSISVKDCLDKYCLAYRTKKAFEIEDLLEKCCLMCAKDSGSERMGNETWTDFQQG
ncbi:hypothetical protein HJC23_011387 [Cyclotella cryptica]|uniref:FPL domain-containing protein n=1 Tax=Cyclotella cryptica TaxID=29204 RepID=A0ABD3PQQ1_9STRA|eukprot:CCRYP_012694-RB/>CCRYP_012694-RB protein AED:0.22 eAED:0.22 QI:424/1/1/1/0.75/0.6/5/366/1355